MKKIIIMIFILLTVFGISMLAQAEQSDKRSTKIEQSHKESTQAEQSDNEFAKINIVLVATLSKQEINKIPRNILKQAFKLGWRRTKEGFSKIYSGKHATVEIGKFKAISDNRGRFKAPNIKFEQSSKVQLYIDGNLLKNPVSVHKHSDGTISRIDVKVALADHNMVAGKGISVQGRGPMNARCLDYNGPYGNQRNYSRRYWRSWVNFIGSDCDVAFFAAQCWRDVSGGCWRNPNCSPVIHHSWRYHRHRWYGGPSR